MESEDKLSTPLALLQRRHSVRAYSEEAVPPALLNKLKATVTMINTHQHGLKFQIITDDPEPMKAFSRSYGSFTNPRNYMAAVVDTAVENVYERAGYFAEQFAIKAVEIGLGTCFVGGTLNSGKVKAQLRAGEKVAFIVLFGFPLGKEKILAKLTVKFAHRKTMAAADFFEPTEEAAQAMTLFPDLKLGLEGIACAPSSLNKRPVRVVLKGVGENAVPCAKVEEATPTNLVDLGIAKFNYNYATTTECAWGNGASLVD
ncbi:MAG: hypothetical protein K2J63_00625 [Muribaculaceae bacterium]|nr:hypothetical protein [Muribaculaceae bacterium]